MRFKAEEEAGDGEEEAARIGFRVVHVFDISHTDDEPLPPSTKMLVQFQLRSGASRPLPRLFQVATALAASEWAVSQWLAAARREGPEALRSRPAPGHPAKLTADQRRLLPDFLWHGPEAYGFRGAVWTCARVARVIREEFGVSYSKSQVSRILKGLRWTPQAPVPRAIQRDEEAIERWRAEAWPALRRRARRERRTLVFVDESGFYLLPGVVKSYSPEGLTPVLYEWQTRDHLSVMGGLTPAGNHFEVTGEKLFITNAIPGRPVGLVVLLEAKTVVLIAELPKEENEQFHLET